MTGCRSIRVGYLIQSFTSGQGLASGIKAEVNVGKFGL
jgi:hypothetical protein